MHLSDKESFVAQGQLLLSGVKLKAHINYLTSTYVLGVRFKFHYFFLLCNNWRVTFSLELSNSIEKSVALQIAYFQQDLCLLVIDICVHCLLLNYLSRSRSKVQISLQY